jgi:hypothetical protein
MNSLERKKFSNIIGWSYFLFLISITIGILYGYIDDYIYLDRHSMGFQNANFYTIVAFTGYISFFFAKNKKMTYISFLFLIITSMIYTGTKTDILALILSSFLIGITYILFLINIPKKIIAFFNVIVALSIYVLAYTLIFFSTFILREYPFIDILLSYRITLISRALDNEKDFSYLFFGGSKVKVDSFYLEILTSYGFIFTFFVAILFFNAIYIKTKYFDYRSLFLLYTFLFMSITEQLLSPSLFFTIIIFTILFESIHFKKIINLTKG